MIKNVAQEEQSSGLLMLLLIILVWLAIGFIIAIIAMIINNDKQNYNSIRLVNQKVFEEFMCICLIVPPLGLFLIITRYIVYKYNETHLENNNEITGPCNIERVHIE